MASLLLPFLGLLSYLYANDIVQYSPNELNFKAILEESGKAFGLSVDERLAVINAMTTKSSGTTISSATTAIAPASTFTDTIMSQFPTIVAANTMLALSSSNPYCYRYYDDADYAADGTIGVWKCNAECPTCDVVASDPIQRKFELFPFCAKAVDGNCLDSAYEQCATLNCGCAVAGNPVCHIDLSLTPISY